MKYKTEKDLNELYSYIDEADLALSDKSRTINDSELSKKIAKSAAASGLDVGRVAMDGTIGMLTPLVPIVLVTVTARVLSKLIKNKKEEDKARKAKELAYKQAIAKQNAIIKALKEESNADKERIEYLVGLNQLLQEAILELQEELKKYQ